MSWDTKGASKPVEYEIRKLLETNNVLAAGNYPRELNDQLVESYALHLRNLIEFLYDKPKEGYIRAGEFFSDPKMWRTFAGTRSKTLGKAQGQASAQVAHLTYDRVDLTSEEKEWLIGPLSREIVGVLAKFLSNADEDRLGPELVKLKNAWGLRDPPEEEGVDANGRPYSRRTT
jgi:hypothetical protein